MTNPGLGFYSRHLTEDDVQVISANTRKLIFNNGQVIIGITAYHKFIYNSMHADDINAQVPADAPGDNTDDDSNLIKAENILNRLLLCGNYENIIKNIFKYLNATQLACLQKVPLTKQTL